MRPAHVFSVLALCLAVGFAWRAGAVEQPRVIPQSAPVSKPVGEVFNTLKVYFSDPGLSRFNLVSADEATHTIVAKETGIDIGHWRQWAACKTSPLYMLYQLSDGTVTVTAKLAPGAQDTTFATITADFQGTYELAGQTTTIPCISTGTLEENILAVAGATTSASGH